jgi:hypothetical protein
MSLFFKKKQVRLHLHADAPSIDGILVARPNGFYRVLKPEVVLEENQSHSLEGEVWVQRENVLFLQVLS